MSKAEKFLPATYRGFNFLISSGATSGGQQIVDHRYPNRDDRFAEPLGKVPPILNRRCIIHGDNFFERRKEFKRLLEVSGLGELVDPVYGTLQVQVGEFLESFDQRRTGEFIFEVPFYTSKSKIQPAPLSATPETTTDLANQARGLLSDEFERVYTDPEDGTDLDQSVTTGNDVLESIQDGIDSVANPVQSALSEVRSNLNEFRNKITRIMQTATGLRSSLDNVYNDLLQLSLDPAALSAAFAELIDFSNIVGPTNTVKRERNETNKSITAEHTRINGLIGLIESFAYTEFGTDQEIIDAVALTDDRFNQYFENNELGVTSLANGPDLRSTMLQLRAASKIVIDEQLSNAWQITEIKPGRAPMSLTAYRYYGSLDNIDNLVGLNPSVNVANFNQQIKAITR
jgi:prophage DNA circulation protein